MNKTDNNGFTLVELLIAVAISGMVMLSAFTIFTSQSRMKKTHEQVVEAQQNIRSAMYILERELRIAGYKGNASSKDFGTLGFTGTCNADTLTFTYLTDTDPDDKDGDGIFDEPVLTTITYALFDGDGDGLADDLGRSEDGGTPDSIAENIDDIEFYYTMADGSGTTTPNTPPATLSQIRSVAVSILAKSSKTINVSTDGHSFTTASGATWNNFNDNLFRRFAQTSVICRNLR